jgi:hypothetical protein
MSAIEIGAAALIAFAVVVCVFAVVVAAADAGRSTARRLLARAEARAGRDRGAVPASGRLRGPHASASDRRRPVRRRG